MVHTFRSEHSEIRRSIFDKPVLCPNRPFPSSLLSLFQSESNCETIFMKMTLFCMKMKLRVELIFIWKVSHLGSFWNRGTRELGNGLSGNSEREFKMTRVISIGWPGWIGNVVPFSSGHDFHWSLTGQLIWHNGKHPFAIGGFRSDLSITHKTDPEILETFPKSRINENGGN